MTELTSIWGRLSLDGEPRDGFVRLRLTSVRSCATYAARHVASGAEALVLEVEAESVQGSPSYPQSVGFDVRAEALEPGRSGRTRILLVLTNERYRDIFQTLCADVVRKLEDVDSETEAVRTFVSRLVRWQAFVRKHGTAGLSLEARRGLYGELRFLQDLLSAIGMAPAVSSWKGSMAADHDFQFSSGSIEIKSTSANTPHTFRVNNAGQLNDRGVPCLFLQLLVLNESEGGAESLPELVDTIRHSLASPTSEDFEDALAAAGYLESQRDLYSAPRYSVRAETHFRVSAGFPRLLLSDLPDGVEDVSYAVAIAACTQFELGRADVFRELLHGDKSD